VGKARGKAIHGQLVISSPRSGKALKGARKLFPKTHQTAGERGGGEIKTQSRGTHDIRMAENPRERKSRARGRSWKTQTPLFDGRGKERGKRGIFQFRKASEGVNRSILSLGGGPELKEKRTGRREGRELLVSTHPANTGTSAVTETE